MVQFSGLPGIRRKRVNAEWAKHTPTGFFAALEKARVATAASDAGSVTVYIMPIRLTPTHTHASVPSLSGNPAL